jgi:hypothetical protein
MSMMMAMSVMAAVLHLPFKLKAMPWHCQIEIFPGNDANRSARNESCGAFAMHSS